MHRLIHRPSRFLLIGVCAVALAAADSSVREAVAQAEESLGSVTAVHGEEGRYDVSFEGGTLAEYCDLLRASVPDLKLAVHPDADRVELPAIDLPGVTMIAAVRLPSMLIPGVESRAMNADGMPLPGKLTETTFVIGLDPELVSMQGRERTFDLEFPGGSAFDFVEALREEADANVVIAEDAESIMLPPMRLRDATVENVMKALIGRGEGGRLWISWSETEAGQSLYFVSRRDPAEEARDGTAVWSLAELVDVYGMPAEQVIGAIDAAAELLDDEVGMRYHEGTRLLIARAPQRTLNAVDQIIGEARESAEAAEYARRQADQKQP